MMMKKMCRFINNDENEGNILVDGCQRQSRASSFVLDIFTLQPCVHHVNYGMFPGLPLCWWLHYSVSQADTCLQILCSSLGTASNLCVGHCSEIYRTE